MKVTINVSTVAETKGHQLAFRFILGGLVTALVGVITMRFGPVIGGLFLGFPAIFPASITLVQAHETQKKRDRAMNGVQRGRDAAGAEAAGAAMGSLGLFVFGFIVWQFAAHHSALMVLTEATVAWFIVAVLVWAIRKRL